MRLNSHFFKKNIIFLTLSIIFINCIHSNTLSNTDFVTTWDTTKEGISNNTSITIPTFNGIYYFKVDWNNDGIYDEINITKDITHDFKIAGIYTIRISGIFPHFTFNNKGDKLKIIEINQWGTQKWKSMDGMFWGCENLIGKANDIPDLSHVVNMDGMFQNAKKFNQDIGNWDTSNIYNMAGLFSGASSFNHNINNWITSNVNSMESMFQGAISFNQNLDRWDTSNVTNMKSMFQLAIRFNGKINTWDTSKVTTMKLMFSEAENFNQNLNNWDTQNVKTMNMMFFGAISFNQDINSWNTSNVTNMNNMFRRALSLTKIISWYSNNNEIVLEN